MRRLLVLLFSAIFFSTFTYASENLYWSNIKDGPYSVAQAKNQLANRKLDPIEGIWFDDGLGTLAIIKDEQYDRFKMFIIDIPAPYKQFNQTWEATFYKSQRGYNFFSRVWYEYPGSSKKLFKTQSGSAILSISTNEMIMDYEKKSDSGREMDHSLKKIWPADTLAYNKNLPRANNSNTYVNSSNFDPSFNPREYAYNFSTDYKGINDAKRFCHKFIKDENFYYVCLDDSTKRVLSYTFEDGSEIMYRYNMLGEGKNFVTSSVKIYKPNLFSQHGGWKRKNGTVLFGFYDYNIKKWIAYESNGSFKSQTNLNSTDARKHVIDAKSSYFIGLDVKKNIESLLRYHKINLSSTNYKKEKPTVKSNNKSVQKKSYQEKSYKDYWWVVVLIGVATFFVYMHTTKNINPKKKKAAVKTKIKQTKVISKVANNTNILLRFFRGELSLPVSYWLWLGGVGVSMTLALTLMEKNRASDELVGISSLFFLAVYIYLYIGTWRSAENYKTEKKKQKLGYGWAITAQGLMIIGIIRFFVELFKEIS
jgi:hypothetical protein